MHPIGAFVTGAIAGMLFMSMFTCVQNKWRIDDVLGVWPLHGLCGAWGGIAAGVFGLRLLGGRRRVVRRATDRYAARHCDRAGPRHGMRGSHNLNHDPGINAR
jgi:ammonia channel protein AmtB